MTNLQKRILTSIVILPLLGEYNLDKSFIRVLLPLPLFPTIPTKVLVGISMSILFSICFVQ